MENAKEQDTVYPGTPKNRPILKLLGTAFSLGIFLFSIILVTHPFFPTLTELEKYLPTKIFKKTNIAHTILDLDTVVNKELSNLGISKDQIKVQIYQNAEESPQERISYLYEVNLPIQYTFSDIQNRFYQAIQKVQGKFFEIHREGQNQEVFVLTLGLEQTITHTFRFIKQTLSIPQTHPEDSYSSQIFSEKTGFFPRVAIVIDDVGYNEEPIYELLDLGEPLTFAIIPHLEKSVDIAEFLKEKSQEVILHIPMEPEETSFIDLGRGGLWTYMENREIEKIIRENIAAVPYIKGVSNHMGSRFTSRPEKMQVVLNEVKKSGLFFLDSRTTAYTVGYKLAKEMGLKSLERDIFLDGEEDLEYIKNQLKKVESLALKEGKAIAIGHPKAVTIEALRIVLPEFKKKNIEMVSVSKLIE